MALELELFLTSLIFCLVPLLFLLFLIKLKSTTPKTDGTLLSSKIPKSYPIIGSFFSFIANKDRRIEWISDVLQSTSNLTFTLICPLSFHLIYTANPSNVHHMLKARFDNYPKGPFWRSTFADVLGDGIFNVDGDKWKYQRQIASHEFNITSLRKFIETVVYREISGRLIPILATAAANKTVVDFQDILQRFAFDNVCNFAFGYDPGQLLPPSGPPDQENFSAAFDDAVRLSFERLLIPFPFIWKIRRALDIGSEKKLRVAVEQVRKFAKEIVREKQGKTDLLSRFLSSTNGQPDEEDFVMDNAISFILAGRDTISAALTWFFWLISKHPQVESQILKEISNISEGVQYYDEVKNKMMYTQASLAETMRLYPPVPEDIREATEDDILPDGTFVKKGTRVIYHPYAMGRVEKVWGKDWAEFRPERWLNRDAVTGNWIFVAKDAYTYPVFQAGPRICLGKEMAFLQMKSLVAAILQRFKVVPVVEQGVEPVFISNISAKMQGGFPVTIQERVP
ncbi:hypothetical protein HAX54_005079 [Datura stramonium]|uniref:Cytochrome P450 n=1 Tax=Datura stramonium TaxID=4076 RepID=A0ABS8WT97_DATST|nr:hypothetical protein [Datura stramonium]